MPTFVTDDREARRRMELFLTLAMIALGIFTTYLPDDFQRRVAAVARATLLRPFLAAERALSQARLGAVETTHLRAQMDSLLVQLRAQAPLREENTRLRALLELQERTGPEFRAAEVVRPGVPGSDNMFLLDVGSEDGVFPGAPVITVEGLVGVIREVGPRTAIGMDWGHPDFRASAMTADGSAYGIVEPRRGDFREDDRLVLTGTAFHTDLEPGTLIVTSGRGGIYPRAVPIGEVVGLEDVEAGWRKSYQLMAVVRPARATHVLVGLRSRTADPAEEEGTQLGGDGSPTADRSALHNLERAWPPGAAQARDSLENERASPPVGPSR